MEKTLKQLNISFMPGRSKGHYIVEVDRTLTGEELRLQLGLLCGNANPCAVRVLENGHTQYELFVHTNYRETQCDIALALAIEAGVENMAAVKILDPGVDFDLQQLIKLLNWSNTSYQTAPLIPQGAGAAA